MDQQQAQDKVLKMQEDLQGQKVIVDKDNVHVSMRGDLYIEELNINGESSPTLIGTLNEAIAKGKNLAAQALANSFKE